MPSMIDAALIGAGGFAQNHMGALERLQNEKAVRIAAVADPRIKAIAATAHWKDQAGLQLYEDYRKLITDETCDLIGIATPPFLHREMVEAALAGSRAHLYLEKPPVPLFSQLEKLIEYPGAERVAVGFQYLEAGLIQDVKRRLVKGEIGGICAIRASSATPRSDSYYQRSRWAGRLTLEGRPVFDGPASNGLAHLVHLVMYFAGADQEGFAAPKTVTGRFLRARPIEGYDFAYLGGTLDRGAAYEIAVGHCSHELLPWTVCIEGSKGKIVFRQTDMASRDRHADDLLYQSYSRTICFARGELSRPTTRLQDCTGYLQAVCGGFTASQGVFTVDSPDIRIVVTEGAGCIYSVQKAIDLIRVLPEGKGHRWFDVPSPQEAGPAARQCHLLDNANG